MSLFSNLFKPKKVVETPIGLFTLTYSRKNKNIWSCNGHEYSMSVRGTDTMPEKEQLFFLENREAKIAWLTEVITKRFIDEFREAGIETNFSDWEERFKIVDIDVMTIFEGQGYWNITFEDLETPFTHFTLFIEGEKTTDFSIDT